MTSTSSPTTSSLRQLYLRDGFVILPTSLPPTELTQLRNLCDSLLPLLAPSSSSAGPTWPHTRKVGKQFPPFDLSPSGQPDHWGIQHLMHPALPGHAHFRAYYTSQHMTGAAAELLACDPSDLQMELFNLLINPHSHAFALGWHRDDVRADVSGEEEEEMLGRDVGGIQWNTALWGDECLFVVPSTHRRVRSEEERRANRERPPEAVLFGEGEEGERFDGSWEIDPPQTLRVRLKAGETIFYSQRILHRASYLPTRKRQTLHGCYGYSASAAGEQRARMILQHGVEWLTEDSYGEGLTEEREKVMWENLMKGYRGRSREGLGYSLEG